MIFAEIWAASYETQVQFTFCMSEAAGRQISSAPPILFKRMGGTKRYNRIFQILTLFCVLYKKCKPKNCIEQVF